MDFVLDLQVLLARQNLKQSFDLGSKESMGHLRDHRFLIFGITLGRG
jgi:hypothetical protein